MFIMGKALAGLVSCGAPAPASSDFAAPRRWMEFGVFATPVAESCGTAGAALGWEREG